MHTSPEWTVRAFIISDSNSHDNSSGLQISYASPYRNGVDGVDFKLDSSFLCPKIGTLVQSDDAKRNLPLCDIAVTIRGRRFKRLATARFQKTT